MATTSNVVSASASGAFQPEALSALAFRALPPQAYGVALAGHAGWRLKRQVLEHLIRRTDIDEPPFVRVRIYAEDLRLWAGMGLWADELVVRETFEPAETIEDFVRTTRCRPRIITLRSWDPTERLPKLPGYWRTAASWSAPSWGLITLTDHKYRRVGTARSRGIRVTR